MIDLKMFEGKRVLMLVGPESPFFYRLAKDIKRYAEVVYKINLSGGCWLFFPIGAVNFRGRPDSFDKFLQEFVKEKKIDTVIMFNDGKLVHRIAKRALKNDVDYYVLEKGYIRPDFITFEKGGVNGNSPMVDNVTLDLLMNYMVKPVKVRPVGVEHPYVIIYSILYYLGFNFLKPIFPASSLVYRNINKFALGRVLGAFRQLYFKITQGEKVNSIVSKLKNRYYFIPLQVHNDVQIRLHSSYKDVSFFIEEVVYSFSKYAPTDTYIVFKHHPIDLGYRDYTKLIKSLSEGYGVEDRVFYVKTGSVDKLIENCIGVVTINSTVGMSALMHLKPVKVMGKAVYDVDGLVCKLSLDDFWSCALNFKPDKELVEKFVSYVMENALVNGSIYKKITYKNHTGVFYVYYEENYHS